MASTSYVDTTTSVEVIGARTTSAGAAATDLTAEEARLINAVFTEGYLTSNAFKVQASAGMVVTVGSGAAKTDLYCVAGEVAGQGNYLVRLAGATQNVTVPAADASLSRTDEVYLIVADAAYDAGSVSLPRIGYRTGTAGGGAPGPDAAWKASVKLATIAVGAAVTSITGGNITDNRSASVLTVVANLVTAKGDLLAATATGTLARLAVGANGKSLLADSTATPGVAWGDLPGTILAAAYHDPSTAASQTTTSSTFAATDTTNLRATFTVPASGKVIVKFGGFLIAGNPAPGSTAYPSLGVLNGSTVVATVAGYNYPEFGYLTGSKLITGLTPGASLSYDLALASGYPSATNMILQYGGGLNTNGYGPAFVEVMAA